MARTDEERFDQTMTYLRTVESGLAAHIEEVNTKSKAELGALLSLEGIWSKGHLYRGQHDALRALLLCQAVYLRKPWARKRVQDSELVVSPEGVKSRQITGFHYDEYALAWQMGVPTSVIRNMSESQIKERILAYWPLQNPTRADLAKAARCEDGVKLGTIDFRDLTRKYPCRFQSAICYDGVKQFLFKAGFLSIRWLTHQGPSLESHTANDLLGRGREVSPEVLDSVGEGWIFNFHGGFAGNRNNEDVCHWGVTLGAGLGAGTNTTGAEGDKRVTCLAGSLHPGCWAKFKLRESYEVCEIKYGKERDCETVIRIIDPTTIAGFF